MAKIVPIADEKAYIKAQKSFELAEVKRDKAKLKLLSFYERGYTFTLIRPSDVSAGAFTPPWKKIALEFMKKIYKTEAARKKWWQALYKRFPKREKAPTLKILGKKAKVTIEEV